MYQFTKNAMRSGISCISKRYSKANNQRLL